MLSKVGRFKAFRPRGLADWVGLLVIGIQLASLLPRTPWLRPLINLTTVSGLVGATRIFVFVSPPPGLSPADTGLWIGCEYPGGRAIEWKKYDSKLRAAVPGPHRRKVLFVALGNGARRGPGQGMMMMSRMMSGDFKDGAFKYYYCKPGAMPAGIACDPGASAVWLRSPRGADAAGLIWNESRLECAP